MFATRLFPYDPLCGTDQSSFGLIVLISAKDLEILPYSLISILRLYRSKLEKIWIIAPSLLSTEIEKSTNEISNAFGIEIEHQSDEEICRLAGLPDYFFNNSHAKMEFVKLAASTFHPSEEILVVDGDTLYLKKRVWSNPTSIVLALAQEYYVEHVAFHHRILDLKSRFGLGFVTHHSYFVKKSVVQIVLKFGGLQKLARAIGDGLSNGFASGSFPSEWQMYGDWSLEMSTKNVKIANFNNLGVSRNIFPLLSNPTIKEVDDFLVKIKSVAPTLGSLSLHDYK